jgi:AcrR family transcriptional regulator
MGNGPLTRAAILQAALETVCVHGFEGLNLQPLAKRVGMTKSGLYAHFGSKEALQLATLASAIEAFQRTVVVPAKDAPAGRPRVDALFGAWLAWPSSAGLPGHCPFLAGALEFDQRVSPVRDQLARIFRDFQQILSELVASAIRHGHLPAQLDPVAVARDLLGVRYAHEVSARLLGDSSASVHAMASFTRVLR